MNGFAGGRVYGRMHEEAGRLSVGGRCGGAGAVGEVLPSDGGGAARFEQLLQVYPELFGVYDRGAPRAWSVSGVMVGRAPRVAVPSVWSCRRRSGAAAQEGLNLRS